MSDFTQETKAREIVEKMFPNDRIIESDGTDSEGFIYQLEKNPNYVKVLPSGEVKMINPSAEEPPDRESEGDVCIKCGSPDNLNETLECDICRTK